MYFTYSNILVWRRKYSKVTIFNPQKFSLIEMSRKILSRVIYRCKFSLETKISSEKASQINCVTGIKMSRHLLVCLTTQNKPFCSIEIWDRNEQNNYLKNSPGQYNVSIKKAIGRLCIRIIFEFITYNMSYVSRKKGKKRISYTSSVICKCLHIFLYFQQHVLKLFILLCTS